MGSRGLACVLLAGALLPGTFPAPVHADDGPKSGPAQSTGPLELRIYPVRSLLRGHPAYRVDRGPFPLDSVAVTDQAWPAFGHESSERSFDFGTAGALLSAIQEELADSGAWETPGVLIDVFRSAKGELGDSLLMVNATGEVHAQVAGWLDRATRDVLRTVVLDVAAFRGDATAARAEGGVAAAVARGAWVPLGAVRVTMHPAGSAVGRVGAIRSYLSDHDVEVAIDASSAVPTVGVASEGLAVEASSVLAGDGRVSIDMRGWWATPAAWTSLSTGAGDLIDAPEIEGASFQATVAVGDGTWVLLPGAGAIVFAARARVVGVPASTAPAQGVRLSPSDAAPADGALESRTYPVADLLSPVTSARGKPALLLPTNYTAPEPPPLSPPAPPFTRDSLEDLLRRAAWGGTWEREGAMLDVSERGCRVVTDVARHAQVAALLERLRAVRLMATHLRARVVAVPLTSLPEWWTGLPEGLEKDDGAALLARVGARVVEEERLSLLDGQRRAAVSGAHRTYVAGYAIELADKSVIGKPIVPSLFEGASLDFEVDTLFGAPAASLSLRLDASRALDWRSLPTRLGVIECPVLALVRSRGEVTVPLGTTRIVAVWASGTEIRLFLVTASRE